MTERIDTYSEELTEANRVTRVLKRIGRIAGVTTVVCTVATPFAIFTGYKVVDHLRETTADPLKMSLDNSSDNIKNGLDQNGQKLDGLGHTIESGVPVVISGPETTVLAEVEASSDTTETTTVTITP